VIFAPIALILQLQNSHFGQAFSAFRRDGYMSLVVSLQQRETGTPTLGQESSDYDWPFSVDRFEVARDGDSVRIYFWRDGVRHVGPGLAVPIEMAKDIAIAIAKVTGNDVSRVEVAEAA
jgi:hypothetical protein